MEEERARVFFENSVIKPKNGRIVVSLGDLRSSRIFDVNTLLLQPSIFIRALQKSANELSGRNDLKIGFEGYFGHHRVTPRTLSSSFIKSMVCLEGIVTKCSNVRPKVVQSVHFCAVTKSYTVRQYRDNTSLDAGQSVDGILQLPTPTTYPTKDEQNNPLEIEYGLCHFKDNQIITIQEMPERAPLGQLPRSVEAILDDDLVDACKPGDRVEVIGIYRALPTGHETTSGLYPTAILANNIRPLGQESSTVRLTQQDIYEIIKLSEVEEDIIESLGRSLAPGIFGHDQIKQALVLQLLGGNERNLENGTHLRGDINMLMIGDPSTAKSQLLRAVLHVAPLAINTTGRGSSGVGLTAAVTTDKETGERRLEAGAMVLADRGIVCIDEFDKMSEQDRVAIHEVMEQQTVTISKAGIHASLNARCSVVAAANPVWGQYDKSRRPQENIGLPDSLLSRFDLLFVVLDQPDAVIDRNISKHVLKGHRYRRPGSDMEPEPLNRAFGIRNFSANSENNTDSTPVYEKYNPLLHGGIVGKKGSRPEVLSQEFLKKYIHYAKLNIKPSMSEECQNFISGAYADLRGKQDIKTLPVTPRCLESLIRLSTAVAKSRLSSVVEEKDCQKALDLMTFALYHEADVINEAEPERPPKRDLPEDEAEIDTKLDNGPEKRVHVQKESSMQFLQEFLNQESGSISVEYIYESMNKNFGTRVSREELDGMLKTLNENNKIMLVGSDVHVV